MYKFIGVVAFLFIGCADFTINKTMCDEIKLDPQATVPMECVRYSEDEAEKSINKGKEILSPDDAIQFTK